MSTLDALALGVLLPSFAGASPQSELLQFLERGLAGVCLFGSNAADGPAGVAAYVDAVRAARPDAVVAIDEEGGDVTRLHTSTGSPVPAPLALGACNDLEMSRDAGRLIGLELATLGVNLDLAPVADVNSEAHNPVIGTRSFGSESAAVAEHTVAWVEGLQSSGVSGCVKHFPGHGATVVDSHLGLPVLDIELAMLRDRELAPFRAAVRAGVAAVMTAHVVVPAVDPGAPATTSAPMLGLLRDELGFEGVIVTDALDMAAVSGGGVAVSAVQALAAGADLLCLGPDTGAEAVDEVRRAIIGAVVDGRIAEDRLRSAASRVSRLSDRRIRTAQPQPAPCSGAGMAAPESMFVAARRAVAVTGVIGGLAGARVVRVDTEDLPAWQPAPWGLEADAVVRPGAPLTLPGPVVIQVRDAHRDPEVLMTLDTAPRGSILIEWGWPGLDPKGLPLIVPHGWSRPSAEAVREVLRRAGWDR